MGIEPTQYNFYLRANGNVCATAEEAGDDTRIVLMGSGDAYPPQDSDCSSSDTIEGEHYCYELVEEATCEDGQAYLIRWEFLVVNGQEWSANDLPWDDYDNIRSIVRA